MPPFSSAEDLIASLPALTCPICCEPFGEEHLPVSLDGCRHVFGAECLKAWVTSGQAAQNKCPTCRAVIFGGSQSAQARPSAAAVTIPAASIGTNTDTPYQQVISGSDYEYETHSNGVFDCGICDSGTCDCEEVLARGERILAESRRTLREHEEFIADHDRRMEESRRITEIANFDPARALAMHNATLSPSSREYIRQRRREDAYNALTSQIMFRGPVGNSLWEEFLEPCVQQIANEVEYTMAMKRCLEFAESFKR